MTRDIEALLEAAESLITSYRKGELEGWEVEVLAKRIAVVREQQAEAAGAERTGR